MAIYYLDTKVISRGKGRSSIAAAAYRSAEKILDQANNRTFDYTNKKNDVFYKEILLPKGAPEWMNDRTKLWNFVEQYERRKDSQLSREITLALPKELTKEQNIDLAKEFVKNHFVDKGMVADVCLHKGHGDEQPHVHVMLTMRQVNEHGFGMKVTEWNKKALLYEWRQNWANTANKHLALAGLDIKIDHRSNIDRGIDLEPQNKIGPKNGRARFDEKALEHQQIARTNGEKIFANPQIAIHALTLQQSTFTHHDLARFINTHTADAQQFSMVYQKVKVCEQLVKLGVDERGQERFSSTEMLDLEYKMFKQSQGLADKALHQVDFDAREEKISEYKLTDNQAKAFRHITGDRDLACIIGYAGSGKSYMLGAAKETWQGAGYTVVGMTLSAIAAQNLEGSSKIESHTVANRLTNWDNDRQKLTSNHVVVIDEAGMLGSRDLGRIIDEAVLAESKVVLIGDPEQLQAIAAGGAFRGILGEVGHIELNEVKRQNELWQRQATQFLAVGGIRDALLAYQRHQMLHEFEVKSQALDRMVSDWHELSLEHPQKTSIMLAFRKNDVKELNDKARSLRQHYGELGDGRILDTSRGKREFAIGDKVYFLENNKDLGVRNGSLGIIKEIDEHRLAVNLGKREVSFDITDYDKIDYGYATTIHKAQGITVDRAFVLSSKGFDRHLAYVSLSRHRELVDLYWSKDEFKTFSGLVSDFERERPKDLTSDYINEEYATRRNIEPLAEKDLARDISEKSEKLNYIDRGDNLAEVASLVKRELKCSKIRFSINYDDPSTPATYKGEIEIDNKKISIFVDYKTAYILESVHKKDLGINQDVRLLCEIVDGSERIRAVEKHEWINAKTPEYFKDQENRKAERFLDKATRGLGAKEYSYAINDKITTKDMYQALYNKIPEVLHEFGFVKKGNLYISTTGYKIDGSFGHKGKVYVYENNPGMLIDYTRGNTSIWDYISKTERITNKAEVFEYIASVSGLRRQFATPLKILREHGMEQEKQQDLNMGPLSRLARDEQFVGEVAHRTAAYSNVRKDLSTRPTHKLPSLVESREWYIWEKVHQYSLERINVKNNQVIKYLSNERGYSNEDIRKMEVGYIPNKKDLSNYLLSHGVSEEETKEVNKAMSVIGYTHKLIAPYRDQTGNIIGLAARDINHDQSSKFGKYIYTKGLARSSTLFGIHQINKDKPLIIVEGIFDSLSAKANGIENVVALGGSGMSARQLNLLDKLHVKDVKLCLDNDTAGIKASKDIALLISSHNQKINLKQVILPNEAKDMDHAIRIAGKDKTLEHIENAKYIELRTLQLEQHNSLTQTFAHNPKLESELNRTMSLQRGLEL